MAKQCIECGEDKEETEFKQSYNSSYLRRKCKTCSNIQGEKSRDLSTRKEQERAKNLMNKFGMTVHQYNELLEKQNNRCAICDRHESEFKVRLCVDHNHVTNEIRGLLCTYCNHRVIGRHRNGDLLRKMADYVDGGTGWYVPKKRRPKKRKKGTVNGG